jgi:Raf kinase inhibitor-like YbhB/YbcL family protein
MMKLESPAFPDQGSMPKRFAKEGGNVSPPLSWDGLPARTRSLVLIVEDIDLPLPKFLMRTWVHWIVSDIPAGSPGVPEGIARNSGVPGGGVQGRTSYRRPGWGGPAPIGGEHRYVFRLFALDCILGLPERKATKAALVARMEGHVLARAELVGKYTKQRPG